MSRKAIEFDYNDEHYTLCFTIDSLKKLEKRGFSFGNISDHALTAAEELFYAAFDAYHPKTSRNVREKIYREMSENGEDGEELGSTLFEMVTDVIDEMKPSGNVKWEKSQI